MKHLAVFEPLVAEEILSGKKEVEIRFSKGKVAPFGQVSAGDIVYIKPVGKDIIGQFRVQKVINIDGVEAKDILTWSNLTNSSNLTNLRYATIIFIGQSSRFVTSPIKLSKKGLRGWVVLG